MKIENTLEWKVRFFALYWGQYVGRYITDPTKTKRCVCSEWTVEADFLQLRHVSSITDEEAIEYACIKDREYKRGRVERRGKAWVSVVREIIKGSNVSINIPFQCTDIYSNGEQVDYLRSRGFALPYMGVPVETLIEWGWIKYKEI